MAQIGNVHPDMLVPPWHPARQLTPEETARVGELLRENAEAYIKEQEWDLQCFLDLLPPIPPRRADRDEWAGQLTGRHGGDYWAVDATSRHLFKLRRALHAQDYRQALRLLTKQFPPPARSVAIEAMRPAWTVELQAIRNALEARIDDALEQAVAEKAIEVARAE